MSTARHPQTDGLTERFNETMQILMRCYTLESGFAWISHLPMIELYYNCSINEASNHSPFEVSYYGFQLATPTHTLLPVSSAPAHVSDRLAELANFRVVRELLTLSKQCMDTCSSSLAPTFVVSDLFFLSSKWIHIHSQIKCKHLRDQRLGPFQAIEKVGLKSDRLKLPP